MRIEDFKLEGELLPIKTYPDPILKKIAEPVSEFNQELKSLVHNMLYTMYQAPGIGLAAPQIGLSKRFFVIDVDFEREEVLGENGEEEYKLSNLNPQVFINPEFLNKEGESLYQEGCLSLPEVFEDVKRAQVVTVKYQDLHGEPHTIDAEGLFAICLQHENDHLDGIVFIERLSALKQNFFKKKLLKKRR